jgi:hypothetical protein
MSRRTALRIWIVAITLVSTTCGEPWWWPETVDPDGGQDADAECQGGCPAGGVCVDGACVDQCENVVCPEGTVCSEGACTTVDPCADVVCSNPGEVCQGGECVQGALDSDADGFVAADDCDDLDAERHPGADEQCNGLDDDCDGAVDEDVEPRQCDTACGDGTEVCELGTWSACESPLGGEEECGDCEDEDCDGKVNGCGGDWLAFGTWNLGPLGSYPIVKACQPAGHEPSHLCGTVTCIGPGGAQVVGSQSGNITVNGTQCWTFTVAYSAPGAWECTYFTQSSDEAGACVPGTEVEHLCGVIDRD